MVIFEEAKQTAMTITDSGERKPQLPRRVFLSERAREGVIMPNPAAVIHLNPKNKEKAVSS